MRRSLVVEGDQLPINLTFRVRGARWATYLLIVFSGILIAASIVGLAFLFETGDFGIVLTGVTLLIVVNAVALHYLLWNLYGEERIEISRKIVRHQRNYGWFKNKQKVIPFHLLLANAGITEHVSDTLSEARLMLYDFRGDQASPVLIYQAAIQVEESALLPVYESIDLHFRDDALSDTWQIYSDN